MHIYKYIHVMIVQITNYDEIFSHATAAILLKFFFFFVLPLLATSLALFVFVFDDRYKTVQSFAFSYSER